MGTGVVVGVTIGVSVAVGIKGAGTETVALGGGRGAVAVVRCFVGAAGNVPLRSGEGVPVAITVGCSVAAASDEWGVMRSAGSSVAGDLLLFGG